MQDSLKTSEMWDFSVLLLSDSTPAVPRNWLEVPVQKLLSSAKTPCFVSQNSWQVNDFGIWRLDNVVPFFRETNRCTIPVDLVGNDLTFNRIPSAFIVRESGES